ncbi:MAG TPA: Gfo/Idh/MocA family oxidoreductase [Myxococcales bacterium]|nr:Gfo/Idh/MocA family oxidoreductase [Myxococcales bacterium]
MAGPLRYGMVGGGQGAFIGDVHRRAIALDGSATLVAGCFSRNYDNTLGTGRVLGLDASRLYRSFEEMAEAESARRDGIDFAVIVTPNGSHFAAARAFLSHGIHVACYKPLTLEIAEAEELAALARGKDLLFCVTYTYTGYPAVKHAREMVARGDLGELRFVNAEYAQEWLATPLERDGLHKQAAWRGDPKVTGKSLCVGDIGTHVENMVRTLTGLRIARLCARLDTLVPGRTLDDNASILVDFEGGARGLYWASQVAIGHDNALRVRVVGSKGAIAWAQEDPNHLTFSQLGKPSELLSRGRDGFYPRAQGYSRIPAGHPEGYFEAFANIYKAFTAALARKKGGADLSTADLDFPGVEEGLSGVRFIDRCVESSRKGPAWVEF